MRSLTLTALATLLVGSFSLGAAAQPGPHHGGPHPGGPHGGPPGHAKPHHNQGPQKAPPHPSAHHGKPAPPHHAYHRGAGPDHRWVKGSRVPPQYRGKNYVVNDWRRHGLQPPGRGQQWVQYGGDYLLVSIATGLIAHMVLSR